MKTSIFLLGASLLASGVLAEFTFSGKMTHHGVEVPVEFTPMPSRNKLPNNTTNAKRDGPVSTTTNWAGAIQEAPSSGLFQSITAQWQVPGIYSPGPPLTTDTYWLYEWVGIDSACGVILQSGTAQTVSYD